MPRTRVVTWSYECDRSNCADPRTLTVATLEVTLGDRVSTGRGTVIRDQADADEYARQQGWSVGTRILCPFHAQAGR